MIYFVFAFFTLKIIFLVMIFFMSFVINHILYRRHEVPQKQPSVNTSDAPSYLLIKILLRNVADGINKYAIDYSGRIPSHFIRKLIYKFIFCINFGTRVVFYMHTEIRAPHKLRIGERTIIGDNNILDARGGLLIGNNCNLSSDVNIWTAQHNAQDPLFSYVEKSVTIGDNCWISSRATILPGVTLGEGCVICSGAVVTKNCDSHGIYAGIPAQKIGVRNNDLQYKFDGKHAWFL